MFVFQLGKVDNFLKMTFQVKRQYVQQIIYRQKMNGNSQKSNFKEMETIKFKYQKLK